MLLERNSTACYLDPHDWHSGTRGVMCVCGSQEQDTTSPVAGRLSHNNSTVLNVHRVGVYGLGFLRYYLVPDPRSGSGGVQQCGVSEQEGWLVAVTAGSSRCQPRCGDEDTTIVLVVIIMPSPAATAGSPKTYPYIKLTSPDISNRRFHGFRQLAGLTMILVLGAPAELAAVMRPRL